MKRNTLSNSRLRFARPLGCLRHCRIAVSLFFLITITTQGGQLPAPTITAAARSFSSGYNPSNLFDSGDGEYATLGQGAVSESFTQNPNDGTWVEMDFGSTITFDRFIMRSRATATDFVGVSQLIISNDPVFDLSDQISIFNPSGLNGSGPLQNLYASKSGRYVRWEVLTSTGSGQNLGAYQLWFLATPLGQSMLPTPLIIGSSQAHDNRFIVEQALDGDYGTEYASAGAGGQMYVAFDFGTTSSISGVEFLNRQGDLITSYDLLFSDSPTFQSIKKRLSFVADSRPTWINSATFSAVNARYLRFQATGYAGTVNTGLREIQFFTPTKLLPTITRQPVGGNQFEGDSFTLSATPFGSNPLTFQWLRNGLPLVGCTNTTLFFSSTQIQDSGSYQFVVNNPQGSVTSSPPSTILVAPSQNLIVNGHFDQGNIGFTSTYSLGRTDQGEGTFDVVNDPHGSHSGGATFNDHTSGVGLMLVANGSPNTNEIIWSQIIPVEEGKFYSFSGWGATWGNWGNGFDPNPAVVIIEVNGVTLGKPIQLPAQNGLWSNFKSHWSAGNTNRAHIQVRLATTAFLGNDVAFDDFLFVPLTSDLATVGIYRNVEVEWNSIPGNHYQVQWANTVEGPWTDLGLIIQAENPKTSIHDRVLHWETHFYRVLRLDE